MSSVHFNLNFCCRLMRAILDICEPFAFTLYQCWEAQLVALQFTSLSSKVRITGQRSDLSISPKQYRVYDVIVQGA